MVSRSDQVRGGQDLDTTFRASVHDLRAITRKAPLDQADLAQEACLKLVETSQRQVVEAPRHLLFRVARNLVIDHHRSQARQRRLFQASDGYEVHASTRPDPERALLAAERLNRALNVISAMPPRRRQAFLMHRVEGLSYLEIARRMDVSVKAVEKHISIAMLDLSRKMQAIGLSE